ncbi:MULTISPECIES: WxL domain-containing protein [Lactobacillaceae]|uniref:WxL domain-containing protein n=1 Tax=Lactobacillaceae TaxID=33958 RepID=UPI001457296B|nr:WxL domain-containing protein [Lactobacillus sp. HBUAS51381]NLR09120.1 cell surface protein [Lactobacillus sp. HBUAS51381]
MRIKNIINRASSSLAVVALAMGLSPLVAQAAGPGTATSNLTTVSTGYVADTTGPAEATSNAEFTVTPGMLTLNAVPNVLLNSSSVKTIASSDATLTSNTGATTGGTAYDGNNTGALNVTDYRGDHSGWNLTVGMGPFTSGTSTVNTATLDLDMTPGTMDNTATAAPTSVALTQGTVTNGWITNPSTLWNAAANTGEGDNSATTSSSTNLKLGKQATVSAGTYDATLYWSLQDAPTAAPAA